MTTTPNREALIKLATEYWRLLKLAERTVAEHANREDDERDGAASVLDVAAFDDLRRGRLETYQL